MRREGDVGAIMNYIIPTILSVFVFILAGCGAGGGGSGIQTSAPLTIMSSGEGIIRVTGSNLGQQALIYTSEAANLNANLNDQINNVSDPGDVNVSDFPLVGRAGGYEIRKGTTFDGSLVMSVTSIGDPEGEGDGVAAIYFEDPGYVDTIMVGGSTYSAPIGMGTYSYSGIQTSNARSVVAPGDIGTFDMTLNMSSGTFSYLGQSGYVNVSGNGYVDIQNGRFATDSLSVTDGISGYTGTMHGLLNGDAATSTSGVFHTNDSSPDYSGSFLGNR